MTATIAAAFNPRLVSLIPLSLAIIAVVHLFYFLATGKYFDRAQCRVREPANPLHELFLFIVNLVAIGFFLFGFYFFLRVPK